MVMLLHLLLSQLFSPLGSMTMMAAGAYTVGAMNNI